MHRTIRLSKNFEVEIQLKIPVFSSHSSILSRIITYKVVETFNENQVSDHNSSVHVFEGVQWGEFKADACWL